MAGTLCYELAKNYVRTLCLILALLFRNIEPWILFAQVKVISKKIKF